jgi:hypothetical protein
MAEPSEELKAWLGATANEYLEYDGLLDEEHSRFCHFLDRAYQKGRADMLEEACKSVALWNSAYTQDGNNGELITPADAIRRAAQAKEESL